MTKAQVRTEMLDRLKRQKEAVRRRKSEAIRRKVFRLTAFRHARTVCCYVSLPYEVQTWRMIDAMLKSGKRVVVPVTRPGRGLGLSEVRDPSAELAPGAFGVQEPRPSMRRPVPASEVDLVLVPGIAFDRAGHRLGHGLGYYDRFLARLLKTTHVVGLAYTCQLLDRLPSRPHDHAVDSVLSA